MEDIWGKLSKQFESKVSLSELGFNPPALKDEITKFEKDLDLELPDDFISYLSQNNGQQPLNFFWLPDEMYFLPIIDIIRIYTEADKYVDDSFFDSFSDDKLTREIFFHKLRIPFAYSEIEGAYLFIDLVPGPDGSIGQIIFNINETDFVVLADSWKNFVQKYLDLLSSKKILIKDRIESGFKYYYIVTANGECLSRDIFLSLFIK